MYPSKLYFPFYVHMAIVFAIVMGVLYLTRNPLAILGLWFLQTPPLLQDQEEHEDRMEQMQQHQARIEAEAEEKGDEYQTARVGFHAPQPAPTTA